MADKIGRAKESAAEFLKTSNPRDEAFLVTFNDHARLLSPFTRSAEDLASRMLTAAARGRTALLDAIYLGLSEMSQARNSRRALLIISDGGDNNSRYNENDIKKLVREADTQIYSIGVFEPFEVRSRTQEELNGPLLLNEITGLTGGRAFTAASPNELPDIVTKIGAELRNQYILGYRSSNRAHDSGWRKIKIKLRTPRGLPPLSVYAKKGYHAPSS
jgi:Ca-activated chloride channel family protein